MRTTSSAASSPSRRRLLGPRADALPEAGQRCPGRVRGRVHGLVPGALRDLQDQGRLPDLTGPGQELDAPGRGLGEPPPQELEALVIAEAEAITDHDRIIIRA